MTCCIRKKNGNIRTFKVEDYRIDSISSKISSEENQLRRKLIHSLLRGEEILRDEIIDGLEKKNILHVKEDRVTSVYPVSAVPTDKEVTFKEGSGHAMCAIDAMGFAFTFQQEVIIHGVIRDTGEELILKVNSKEVQILKGRSFYILYPDLRSCTRWSDHCCLHMHFFSSIEAIEEYIEKENLRDADIIALNPEQSLTVAGWIFGEESN